MVAGKFSEHGLYFADEANNIGFADQLAIRLNPLAKRNQMRRREQPHTQSRRAVNAFEHRARRAFAIRAGDVDETELVLWIARARGERTRSFQSKPRAKKSKAVKELNGFGVCHGWYKRHFAKCTILPSAFDSSGINAQSFDSFIARDTSNEVALLSIAVWHDCTELTAFTNTLRLTL